MEYVLEYVFVFCLSNRYFHCSEGEQEVDSQDNSRDDGDNPESEAGLKC